MARICDRCQRQIVQENGEFLQLTIRVLEVTGDEDQDARDSRYADFCDTCIGDGSALSSLLKGIEWTLATAAPNGELMVTGPMPTSNPFVKPTECPAGHGPMRYSIEDDRLHCHCGAVATTHGNIIVDPDPVETKRG